MKICPSEYKTSIAKNWIPWVWGPIEKYELNKLKLNGQAQQIPLAAWEDNFVAAFALKFKTSDQQWNSANGWVE